MRTIKVSAMIKYNVAEKEWEWNCERNQQFRNLGPTF